MHRSVARVTPSEDFTLAIVFDNGDEGVLDIKPYLDFGVFSQLKDYDRFRRVRVAFDTVQWDCGVDLDPEFISRKIENTPRAS